MDDLLARDGAGARSYDDLPDSTVQVMLSVPLLEPLRKPAAAPRVRAHGPTHATGVVQAPARQRYAHRRRPVPLADTVRLGLTAAAVVVAAVLVVLSLVDWPG